MDDRAPVNQILRPGLGSDGRRIPEENELPIRCERRDGSRRIERLLQAWEQDLDHASKSSPEGLSLASSFLRCHRRRFGHEDRPSTAARAPLPFDEATCDGVQRIYWKNFAPVVRKLKGSSPL